MTNKTQVPRESLSLIKDVIGFGGRTQISAKEAYDRCCKLHDKYPGMGWLETALTFRIKMGDEEVPL